jgi:hypothetical protein
MARRGGDRRNAAVPEDQRTSWSASGGPVAHRVWRIHGRLPVAVCHDRIVKNRRGRVKASAPTTALATRRALMILDACGSPRARPCHMTPSVGLEVQRVAAVIEHGHQRAAEGTCRLDHTRECRLDMSARSRTALCA